MTQPDLSSPRIAVVGGGIAGLAAAHRAVELDPRCQVTLFEAGPRPGGVISTLHRDGFQVERSADNFITTVPFGLHLCKRLGLGEELISTNPAFRRTFVVRRNRLRPLPDGFLMMAPTRLWPLAVTPLLSPWGKLRAACEYFIPPRTDDADESMADFVRRRLGNEVFDRLVEPLVSAVYAADMQRLSVLATLSRFREMERDHGSLIRAMRRQIKHRPKGHPGESGARYSLFVTLRDGLSRLVETLTSRLPADSIRLNTPIEKIELHDGKWRLFFPTHPSSLIPHPSDFDALILATPSWMTARLLEPVDSTLAGELAAIRHEGTAIVSLGYSDRQIGHPLDGMGAVMPAVEQSPILAVSFSSRKYPHRAPPGKTLLRVFVGGSRRPDLAEMPDDALLPLVLRHVEKILHVRGAPGFIDLAHWPRTMPQYHVGHKDRIARIETRIATLPRLRLAGNAYHGVGIPDCIHSGETAAERILADFS
ncbi:MAG: protoporphyrinogen oxidase [Pirellulales bacterium]|nr:protoporphyrinogen oxidase [Pirellulales bacterium]